MNIFYGITSKCNRVISYKNRVIGKFGYEGQNFDGEWRAVKGSKYFESHLLYKENGFNNKEQ